MDARTQGVHKYGPWEYTPEKHTLYCNGFELDLTECSDCQKTLKLIFEVAEKSWADEKVLYGLIMAIRAIVHPQAQLCSGRAERVGLAAHSA
jgi:hypothetical protein